MADDNAGMIERLYAVIAARRNADAGTSYTANLLSKDVDDVARKLGEEAVETMIAAARQDKAAAVRESADLIYHLLVLWARLGIAPEEVAAELKRREGQSGIAEKQSRGK